MIKNSGRSARSPRSSRSFIAVRTGRSWASCGSSRRNRYGSLDSGFGASGKVTTPFTSATALGNAVTLQSDGKIVVAGSLAVTSGSGGRFALARYNTNGTLDSSFGSNGTVVTQVTPSVNGGSGNAVAIDSAGGILIAGYAFSTTGTLNDFVIVRYSASGAQDMSFGGGAGKVVTAFAPFGSETQDKGYGIVVQSDGKFIVSGSGTNTLSMARYNPDGSLDSGFGNSGKVTTANATGTVGYGVALQSDGKIVVAGTDSNNVLLSRYTTAGQPDGAFGNTGLGRISTDFGGTDAALSLAIASDDKIIVAGYTYTNTSARNFAVARYDKDGHNVPGATGGLDPTFGLGGKIITGIGVSAEAHGVVIRPNDGRIVVVGFANKGDVTLFDFAATAYHADNSVKIVPAAPTALTASVLSPTQIALTWANRSTLNSGYVVERSSDNLTFTSIHVITDPAVTSFTDTSVTPAALYYYRVRATSGGLSSSPSGQISATTAPPAAPSDLAVTASEGAITLSWTPIDGASGYNVYRSTTSGSGYVKINGTQLAGTNYTDTVAGGTEYFYVVTALNAGGESSDSGEVSSFADAPLTATGLGIAATATQQFSGAVATFTDADPAAAVSLFTATIDWGDNTTSAGTIASAAGTFTVTGAHVYPFGNVFPIDVAITDADGSTADGIGYAEVSDVPPEAPTGALASGSEDGISTFWDPVNNANGYAVLRSGSGSVGTFTAIATLSGIGTTQYFDANLPPHSTYYYEVQATNSAGTSAASNSVSGTVKNSAPVATSDPADVLAAPVSVVHGRPIDINVLQNDTDPEGDPIQINPSSLSGTTSHGGVLSVVSGKVHYAAPATYVGSDSFTYTVSDGADESSPATVSVKVTDAPPEVRSDTYTVNSNSVLSVPATAADRIGSNDSDADNDTLTYSVVANAQHGNASISSNGSLTYTPQASFSGVDRLSYSVNDGAAESNVATITIYVGNPSGNLAGNTTHSMYYDPTNPQDQPYTGVADFSPPYGSEENRLVDGPHLGTISNWGNGEFTYIPHQGGIDSFTYVGIQDGAESPPATVTLVVYDGTEITQPPLYSNIGHPALGFGGEPGQTLPVTPPQSDPPYGTWEYGNLDLKHFAYDQNATDPSQITVQAVNPGTRGVFSVTPTGFWTYTPGSNFVGVDYFSFKVIGPSGESAPINAMVSYDESNVLPAVPSTNDHYSIFQGQTLTVSAATGLLAPSKASDTDGDPLSVLPLQDEFKPKHGTVTVNADGLGVSGSALRTEFIDVQSAGADLAMQNLQKEQRTDPGGIVGLNSASVPLQVRVATGLPAGTEVKLTMASSGDGRISAWLDNSSTDSLFGGTDQTKVWIIGHDTIPSQIYLRGDHVSADAHDVALTLAVSAAGAIVAPGATTSTASTAAIATQKVAVTSSTIDVWRSHVDSLSRTPRAAESTDKPWRRVALARKRGSAQV